MATIAKAHGIIYEDLIANTIKSARRNEPKGYRQQGRDARRIMCTSFTQFRITANGQTVILWTA
ncbi:hypothetical protein [Variovorax sp. UC122_21]|uniref:hypothetical protein n=1 Tax=Variovorax sp. UC122_21 TaxID=3374554 RepID=UPI003756A61E